MCSVLFNSEAAMAVHVLSIAGHGAEVVHDQDTCDLYYRNTHNATTLAAENYIYSSRGRVFTSGGS